MMDFWPVEVYTKFFVFLDKTGCFYYERWGDAPVHWIAPRIFLPKTRIHFFNKIGYLQAESALPQRRRVARGICSCEQCQWKTHGEWLLVFHADEEKQRRRKRKCNRNGLRALPKRMKNMLSSS
ncbi:glycolipid 2-alpha-mannosyltransferase-domain-containing protein [Mycena galericulata]|nr:glycolipid 2-alpha-mannosyltransferase-domain-containing protein [Mycena galericulata]